MKFERVELAFEAFAGCEEASSEDEGCLLIETFWFLGRWLTSLVQVFLFCPKDLMVALCTESL